MASSIVKSAGQQLGKLLVDEANSLYNVRDKIESLQMELKWMECFLRDADTQQHREELVRMWVSQVRDLTYDAEDTVERYLHGVTRHREDGIMNTLKWFSCILFNSDAWTLHNLGSEIDKLTFKLNEISSRLQRYGIQFIRPRSLEDMTLIREQRRTDSRTKEDVIGREKDIQHVMGQLLSEDVNVVGITGIGGLGKTTLAREVFNHEDIKGHFGERNCAWVYISKEFERGKVFQEIFDALAKGDTARTEELPTKIQGLLQKQKCLVVLDDIWTSGAWESLRPAFESLRESPSKILLTTRTKGLLQHVDPIGSLHLLSPLSDEDSWKLLNPQTGHGSTIKTAGGKASSSGQKEPQDNEIEQMKNLGKEMLKHCDGLPIAIKALRGILCNKTTLCEWEDVRTNLSSYLMTNMEQEGTSSGVFGILELSYNELPFHLKPCFLYLGNFPEDYEITTKNLYQLWQAEGFLAIEGDSRKKRGTTYDIGERYLNELVQRSVVQVGKCWTSGAIKTCQVHDVMRDMCLRKCEEVSFLSHIECKERGKIYALSPFSSEMKKSRRLALHGKDYCHEHFLLEEKAIGLRSLLLFNKRCTPARKLWKSTPFLRVLDMKYTEKLYGMKHLIHLRYLSVRESYTVEPMEIPFLSDLQYLETLDLRSYGELVLRHDTFSKMKRLRHLYLPLKITIKDDKKLKFPTSVQMMETIKNLAPKTVKDDKKLRFPTGGQMETIKNLDPEKCETKELMEMTNLRVFSITTHYNFEEAEELKRVLDAPVMKKGQLINTLRIGIHEDVINGHPQILRSAENHPNFTVLRIEGPGKLKKDGNKGITFPKALSRVELKVCETIGEGDLLSGLEKLVNLQALEIDGSFKGGAGGKKICFSPSSFPRLKELKIYSLIEDLFELDLEVGEEAAPNLERLKLSRCSNLYKLNNLPNRLTRVEIINCGIKEGEFPALEMLPHLNSFYLQGNVGKRMSFSHGSFPQLTQLHMEDQDDLEEWEIGEGALANLSSLKLKTWLLLKKVNKLPDSLAQVELQDCELTREAEGSFSLLRCFENLPHLQILRLIHHNRRPAGAKISFSPGSFPQLTQLSLKCTPEGYLEELEFGDGALLRLQNLKLEIYELKKFNRLPDSLTDVNLGGCKSWDEGGVDNSLLACLEKLPHLHLLRLDEVVKQGDKMRFSPYSFPRLTQLHLSLLNTEREKCNREWEWEVGDEALPNLQRLELHDCRIAHTKYLPKGLSHTVLIECHVPWSEGRVELCNQLF